MNQIMENRTEENVSDKGIGHLIEGWVDLDGLRVPIVSWTWGPQDYMGAILVRWGVGRYSYKIPPGLYALGKPLSSDPVLVTGNYKLSFDHLRRSMKGRSAWILVLDSKGINVWCAAGKGTFGSKELINRAIELQINRRLGRAIILPQLGASSMEPHLIRKHTGLEVIYGPVRSDDLPSFLEGDRKADEAMREVRFDFWDRLVLGPVEAVLNIKYWMYAFVIFGFSIWISGGGGNLLMRSMMVSLPFFLAVLVGAFVFPLLLPILPFRAFCLKSAIPGILFSLSVIRFQQFFLLPESPVFLTGYGLLLTLLISWMGFNFTGSSTFTSFSGVKTETARVKPAAKIMLAAGLLLMVIGGGI